jgi:cytochrome c-type biogenesis protein CcmH/NrfG
VKKETIITAIVFLAVGFLAGYITDSQMNWNSKKQPAFAGADQSRAQAGMPGSGGAGGMQGLPEGHPPIDTGAMTKALEDQVAQNPKDIALRTQLGNAYYDAGQWQKAIDSYQEVLEIDPKNVNARTDLGTAYFNMGRPQDALKQYDKALAINPKHEPTIFNSIIVNLEGAHDADAAQKAWDKLNKMNPSYPGLAGLQSRIAELRTSGGAAGR